MKSKSRNALFLLSLFILPALTSCGFVHPGLLHTQADFDRMKAKVSANISPWIDGYNKLTSVVNLGYGPRNTSWVSRGKVYCGGDNGAQLYRDVHNAYQAALVWKITGNTQYADKAVAILNAWSSTLTDIGCPAGPGWDWVLMSGIQGYQFANVGEIMRNYTGWNQTDFKAFQSMMLNKFYPINNYWLHNKFPLTSYANWALCTAASILAIGVVTDNQTIFNEALVYLKTGYTNGALGKSIYFIHPGYLGQGQEVGRDQGHNTLNVAHLGAIAEMAWNQGVDLYSYGNNRILSYAEYTAKINIWNDAADTWYDAPFVNWMYFNWPAQINQQGISWQARGLWRPCWASIYHHYVNRKGLDAPWTGKMMKLVAPDPGACCVSQSGTYDQLGLQTLTFTRDPYTTVTPPSNLLGVISSGSGLLQWWGSINATRYNVKRGTASGGPYTTIANVSAGAELYYIDSGLSSGAYYYVVTAVLPSGETRASNEVRIVYDTRIQEIYLPFDSAQGKLVDTGNGNVLADSSGNGNNVVLSGNASIVAGVMGNALKFDGSSSYITLPVGAVNLSDFTISTWIYFNTQRTNSRLFDFGYGGGRWIFFTPKNGDNGRGRFAATYVDDHSKFSFDTSIALPAGRWIHLAITRLGSTVTIYANGANIGSGWIPLPMWQLPGASDNSAGIWIGRSQFSSDPLLDASLDDFRIFYQALTQEQIAAYVQSLYTYLRFDETSGSVADDSTINNNNGTLVGGASFVAGKFGNAVKLDGSSGYVSLPKGIVSNLADFTISAWVYLNAQNTWSRIFDFGSGTSTYMFFTPRNSAGVARYCVLLNGNAYNFDSQSPLPVGQWTHVAVTLKGNVSTVYINGAVIGTGVVPVTPSQLGQTTQNWIGRSQYSADPYLNGIVDDFKIYFVALPIDLILANLQAVNTYLPFDDASGTIAADYSGNGNNGTLVGNSSFVPGIKNTAVQLNNPAKSAYVSLPSTILTNLSDFTVATWVYINTQANYSRIFDFGYGTNQWVMLTPQNENGFVKFEIYLNGVGDYPVYGQAPLPLGQWVHVAFTLATSVGTIYVNGQVVGSSMVSITPKQLVTSSPAAQHTIGRSQYSADPWLNGIVDDFRIYHGGLTASQIAVLANKVVVSVQFDESSGTTSADSSGNGFSVQLNGGVSFVPGRINNSVKLDGNSGSYITLPAGILTNLSDFTVSSWVYINSQQTWARLFDIGYGTTQYMSFIPYDSNGKGQFGITINGGSSSQTIVGANVPAGQWAHVAITRFGSTGTYYLNGKVAATATITLSPSQLNNGTQQFWIGRSQFSADPYLNGLVDDFRIYRGALSQAEVASLAQTLSVYYKFDESAGSTSAADSSGNNNAGSLIQWSSGNLTSKGTFATGLVGNALSLDGNGSYLNIPSGILTNLGDVTFSAWVYLNVKQTWARVFDFGFSTGRYLIFSPANGNGVAQYGIVLDGAAQVISGAEAVPTGKWVHVAVTVSGNNGTYYINGRAAATASVYLEPFQLASGASTAGLTVRNFIGKSQFSGDPYLNGAVDEFRVYGGALSASQVAALAQALTAQLSFSESSGTVTADQTGNGNIGQLSGGATFVTGRNGNAVKVDGSSGYVSLPSGILSSSSDLTIATWVYINTQVTWARVFDFGTGTNVWMFLTPRNADNGNARFSITLNGNNGRQNIDGNAALPTGVWVHVAVTLSGNVGTLYVNGSVSGTATITIDPSQLGTTTNNYIGKSQFSADPYLNALVDDFRVYYRALPIDQIASLSQRLNVYLKFDETSGSTAADSSGNGNSGTLVGNATFTTGVSGKALALDGNSSFVNLTNSATLLATLSDFTISSWVYLKSAQQWARLFDFGFSTSRYMMFTTADDGDSPKFTIYNGADNAVWANQGTVDLPVGKWTHVAITLQTNVLTIYFNATLTGQGVIDVAPNQIYDTDIPASNYIGRSQFSGDPNLNATVDDFRLYSGAFSAVQVAALYNKQI